MLKNCTVLIIMGCFVSGIFGHCAQASEKITISKIMVEESAGAGVGFIGGMTAMGIWMVVCGAGNAENMKLSDYLNSYVIGSTVSSAFGVYITGMFAGDKGQYINAIAGSAAGTIAGYVFGVKKNESFALYAILLPILQSAGAVTGFNFLRLKDALVSSDRKGVSIGLPRIFLSAVSGNNNDLSAGINLLKIFF